jgi:hypothetical protein
VGSTSRNNTTSTADVARQQEMNMSFSYLARERAKHSLR